jgi:uncharacterized delta-60 repeat protein
MSARARSAVALAALLLIPVAASASGGLDATFGDGGVAYSSSPLNGAAASGDSVAEDAAGGIVVAGVATDSTASPHITVWRLNANGRVDSAFGRGGAGTSAEIGWAWNATLDGRGRLLAAGIKSVFPKPSLRAVLERWNPDGARDAGFASGGRAEAQSPFGGFVAEGGAVATDGASILLAGQGGDDARRLIPAVWRLNSDGAFTAATSSASAVRLSTPDGTADARVSALIPRVEGGWWAAGSLDWRRLALWRLKADGSVDWDFASAGLALSDGVGRAVSEDGSGGVWVAGFADQGLGKERREFAVLAHFQADGSTVSWTTLDVPGMRDREAFALVRAVDGRLFVGGYADSGERPVRACLWALKPDGTPDLRFGRGGVLLLPLIAGGEERIYALALDAHGRLLAAGMSSDAKGRFRRAVWRFTTR